MCAIYLHTTYVCTSSLHARYIYVFLRAIYFLICVCINVSNIDATYEIGIWNSVATYDVNVILLDVEKGVIVTLSFIAVVLTHALVTHVEKCEYANNPRLWLCFWNAGLC